MNQNEKFNDILSECLDQILKGETVEQCLRNHPEQATELEPLLRTALAARAASQIQPRSEFRARARYEFQSALRDMEIKKSQRKSLFSWRWQWQSGWALAMVAVIVVVLGGGGTVAASSYSMPGDTLYSLKLASEQVQLAVTPSEIGKTELNSKFADRRTDEIIYMASKGDAQEVQMVAQRLNTNLENITNIVAAANSDGASKNSNNIQPANGDMAAPAQRNEQPLMGIAAAPVTEATSEVPPVAAPFNAPEATSEPVMAAASIDSPTPEATAEPVTAGNASKALPPALAVPEPAVSPERSPVPATNMQDAQVSNYIPSEEWARIKSIIVDSFNDRQARLESALQNASPEVRPAIRQAIANSLAEYEKALSNLEQMYGSN